LDSEEMSAYETLFKWCLINLNGYDSIKIKNFSTSWRDGRPFIAILNRHRPDKIDYNDNLLRLQSNKDNLRKAFQFAYSEFGVEPIIDPSDIDTDEPDERSIVTYISMLATALQNDSTIPPHPDDIKNEKQQEQLYEEYSTICRSLMQWLKDSISKMDNRNVPNNVHDIKKSLNDIKVFRLDEYAMRLRDKKRLFQLYQDLTWKSENSNNNNNNNNVEIKDDQQQQQQIQTEIQSVDKVWSKFDHYIRLRENLLEKTLKKYENFENKIEKFNKIYNSSLCYVKGEDNKEITDDDTIDVIENDLNKLEIIYEQLLNDKFDKKDDINELKDHFNNLSSILSNLKEKKTTTPLINNKTINENDKENAKIRKYLNWINNKEEQIQIDIYPTDPIEIRNSIEKTSLIIEEIERFYENKIKSKIDQQKNSENHVLINEFNIAYNLLWNSANFKLKRLEQLSNFIETINNQMNELKKIEKIELSRDWSHPEQLDSKSLKDYKQILDSDLLYKSINSIEPILLRGSSLIDDNHPASQLIQTYSKLLSDYFDWIQQLSHLFGIHLKSLIEFESYHHEIDRLTELIERTEVQCFHLFESKSPEDLNKLEILENDLASLNEQINNLIIKIQTFTSLKGIKIAKFTNSVNERDECESEECDLSLMPHIGKCKSLITHNFDKFEIKKGQEYLFHDKYNGKLKVCKPKEDEIIKNKDVKSINSNIKLSYKECAYLPSVCFTLTQTNDSYSVKITQRLSIKYTTIRKCINNHLLKAKKEDILKKFDLLQSELKEVNISSFLNIQRTEFQNLN
jgi:HPt (histidine-containing phosphotransfer) domain-containing protein